MILFLSFEARMPGEQVSPAVQFFPVPPQGFPVRKGESGWLPVRCFQSPDE